MLEDGIVEEKNTSRGAKPLFLYFSIPFLWPPQNIEFQYQGVPEVPLDRAQPSIYWSLITFFCQVDPQQGSFFFMTALLARA